MVGGDCVFSPYRRLEIILFLQSVTSMFNCICVLMILPLTLFLSLISVWSDECRDVCCSSTAKGLLEDHEGSGPLHNGPPEPLQHPWVVSALYSITFILLDCGMFWSCLCVTLRHYVVLGPSGTPYENGCYHGKLCFPSEYPFKPPSIYMLTPNGRFTVNTRWERLLYSNWRLALAEFNRLWV